MDKANEFLRRVWSILAEGQSGDLVSFKHPQDLEKILDLDVTKGIDNEALEKCVRKVLEFSVRTDKATFRNQLFGATDPYGLAGAWISEAYNTSQYTYEVAPAFTLIENQIIRHALTLFGLDDGDGIFSPGGSLSMLYGIVAARFKRYPEVKSKGMRGLPELVLYTSQDSHYSIKKATHWLGFGTDNLKAIRTDNNGLMCTVELEKSILDDIRNGKQPLLVNATAGTTVLGAIDDLEEIDRICEKYNVWMHADACWGGSLILSQKYKNRLKGIERANSISWNLHKMMGAPLQCSMFLVKERGLLHEANSTAAHYLFQQDKFYDVNYDTGDKSVQCGRKIDAFKLWLMWKARGDRGLETLVDRTMDTAIYCRNQITATPGFRLVAETIQCPNVCFWYIPEEMRDCQEDDYWWNKMHKITPKIKELLMINSKLMVCYSPLANKKNFFRLAFPCHPDISEQEINEMLLSIAEYGEIAYRDIRVRVNGHI